MARLVIVEGPASLAPSHFFLSITPPFSSSSKIETVLDTHSPACHCANSRLPTSFPPLTLIPTPASSPSSRPGLSLWQVPPRSPLTLPASPPFWIFDLQIFVSISARLVIVAGPASLFLTAYHFTSFYHSLLSLPIRGPACHCGRSRLVFPFLFLSLFPLTLYLLLPPRAQRPPWEIQSDLADALPS